jgi:hypothetical protein
MTYSLIQLAPGAYDLLLNGEVMGSVVRNGARQPYMWTAELLEDLPRCCQLGAKSAERRRAQPLSPYISAYEDRTGRIAPDSEGAIAGNSVRTGRQTVTVELEVVVDRGVGGEKQLRLPN